MYENFINLTECMNGKALIVTAKNIPSLSEMVEREDKVIRYSGLLFEIWEEIARVNNYKQVFFFLTKDHYFRRDQPFYNINKRFCVVKGNGQVVGEQKGGTWNGMIGMLLNYVKKYS